jgi:alkanesulfonate monooxygenase SsuD/methylene tetrahydromethanopterin reductase-like flavin-dependent oxidoreductase (luciferase family)
MQSPGVQHRARRGFGIPAGQDLGLAAVVAARAEELGYTSVWTNDTPGADGLEVAAAMARATTRIGIGIGAVSVARRPPDEIAARVTGLGLSADRLVLVVGSGRTGRPLGVVREAVQRLREALDPPATIGVAAMGPQMCRLAGEVADYVLLNWMTPERSSWARGRVAMGAEAASRSSPVVGSYVRLAIGPAADERLESEAARYRSMVHYDRHFSAQRAPAPGIAAAQAAEVPGLLGPYVEALDEVVVRALPAIGERAEFVALAEAAAP